MLFSKSRGGLSFRCEKLPSKQLVLGLSLLLSLAAVASAGHAGVGMPRASGATDRHVRVGRVVSGRVEDDNASALASSSAKAGTPRSADVFSFLDTEEDGSISKQELASLKRKFFHSRLSQLSGSEVIDWLSRPKCMPKDCSICSDMADVLRRSSSPLPGLVLFDLSFKNPQQLAEAGLTSERQQATMQLAVLMEIQGHGCLGNEKVQGGGKWAWGVWLVGTLLCLVGTYMCMLAWQLSLVEPSVGVVDRPYRREELRLHETAKERAWLEGRTSRQISLEVGDRITVIDPRPVHESSVAYGGWAYGSTSGAEGPSRGWFPLSFVRLDHGGGAAQGGGGGKRWTWPDRSAKEKKVTFQEQSRSSATAIGAEQGVVFWLYVLSTALLALLVNVLGGGAGAQWADVVLLLISASILLWGWGGGIMVRHVMLQQRIELKSE